MCVQQHPPLETERLMLRAFTDEDLNALQTIYGDEEANTYLPWFPIKNLTEAKKFFEEHYVQSNQNFSVSTPGPQTTALLARPATADYKYAVCLKSDNVPIGYVNVTMTESHDLGYGLRKEFWHQGITTEACKAVIAQLKKDGVPYITATHDVNNPVSYTHQMCIRDSPYWKNGLTHRTKTVRFPANRRLTVANRQHWLHYNGLYQ